MGSPTFWDNQIAAQKHIGKVNGLKRAITGLVDFNKRLGDVDVMRELVEAAAGDEQEMYAKELDTTVAAMVA